MDEGWLPRSLVLSVLVVVGALIGISKRFCLCDVKEVRPERWEGAKPVRDL